MSASQKHRAPLRYPPKTIIHHISENLNPKPNPFLNPQSSHVIHTKGSPVQPPHGIAQTFKTKCYVNLPPCSCPRTCLSGHRGTGNRDPPEEPNHLRTPCSCTAPVPHSRCACRAGGVPSGSTHQACCAETVANPPGPIKDSDFQLLKVVEDVLHYQNLQCIGKDKGKNGNFYILGEV